MTDKPEAAVGTPAEVSAVVKVPEKTLAQWRYKGYGPTYFRAGKHVRYRWEDVNAWIGSQVDASRAASCTASPGDGRGAGGVAATPAPVSHAAPAHVHLGGGPCVYGERCGQ